MLKSYDELRQIDVTPYCEERDGFKYLNWARCIALLHENGAEKVYFEPIPNPQTGSSLYMTEQVFEGKKANNRVYETRIRVVVDDKEWIFQSPVMNGTNPVMDNSMNQLRVWNSMCRSFVKCIAINTGLGFGLWLKEEENVLGVVPAIKDEPVSAPVLKTLKNICAKHGVPFEAWIEREGRTEQTLTANEAGKMLNALKEAYGDE